MTSILSVQISVHTDQSLMAEACQDLVESKVVDHPNKMRDPLCLEHHNHGNDGATAQSVDPDEGMRA